MLNIWHEQTMKEDIMQFYQLYDPLNLHEIRRVNTTSTIIEDINKLYNLSPVPITKKHLNATVIPNVVVEEEGEVVLIDEVSLRVDKSCYGKLKEKRWWKPLMKFFKFAIHFALVMLILFVGAVVFACIEEEIGDYDDDDESDMSALSEKNIFEQQAVLYDGKLPWNYTYESDDFCNGNFTIFWMYVKNTFNVSFDETNKLSFLKATQRYLDAVVKREDTINEDTNIHNLQYVFTKWFYFMTIATTTIGYGDVSPNTENGKFFFIIFSLIGIPLMVTLIKSTGEILTMVNKNFFHILTQYLCKKKTLVSEELLSAIFIVGMFIMYLALGCLFTSVQDDLSLLDSVYYWVLTFTTVGLGDVLQPLKTQVHYIFPLVLYRTFGLALLAGVIDSIMVYMRVRRDAILLNERFQKERKALQKLLQGKMSLVRNDVLAKSKKVYKTLSGFNNDRDTIGLSNRASIVKSKSNISNRDTTSSRDSDKRMETVG